MANRMNKQYFDWVDEYPKYVVLRKEGWLFRAKEECARVLANALDYRLMERDNGIVESGTRQLDSMLNGLSERHINYIAIHFDKVIAEESFDDNAYNSYLF